MAESMKAPVTAIVVGVAAAAVEVFIPEANRTAVGTMVNGLTVTFGNIGALLVAANKVEPSLRRFLARKHCGKSLLLHFHHS